MPQVCYSSGYYLAFYINTAGDLAYVSSQTGSSWSSSSNTGLVDYAPTDQNFGNFGVYCGSSGNVYTATSASATTWHFEEWTSSGGILTASESVSITCSYGGYFCANSANSDYPTSIFAYSTSSVFVGLTSAVTSTGAWHSEIWECSSSCGSSSSWADVASQTTYSLLTVQGFGSSASSGQIAVFSLVSGSNSYYYALSSASNWGGSYITTGLSDFYYLGGSYNNPTCLTWGTNTLYCAAGAYSGSGSGVYFDTFTSGGSSWTQQKMDNNNGAFGFFLSSDGTNVVESYTLVSNNYPVYQTATLSTSPTWSGELALESSPTGGNIWATPTLQSTAAGLVWIPEESGDLYFALTSAISTNGALPVGCSPGDASSPGSNASTSDTSPSSATINSRAGDCSYSVAPGSPVPLLTAAPSIPLAFLAGVLLAGLFMRRIRKGSLQGRLGEAALSGRSWQWSVVSDVRRSRTPA